MERLKNNSETEPQLGELPKRSKDDVTDFYLRQIERDGNGPKISEYLKYAIEHKAEPYDSAEAFLAANPDYLKKTHDALRALDSEENLGDTEKILRDYSSEEFAWINTLLRMPWNYEKLGIENPQKKAEARRKSEIIDNAILAAPVPNEDFMTYRGTDVTAFEKFGVYRLEDLEQMKGQAFVESAFTSTALDREHSFVEQEGTLWIGKSNIEVHYHIPGGCKTCIAMLDHGLSLSPKQTEVLLDKGTLSYVSNVTFDKPGHAVMDAIVIPFEAYDEAKLRGH